MPIKYYEKGRYSKLPLVRALFAANMLFAVATLVAWQWALIYMLGPLNWAANQSMPHEHNFARIFEYPLILFWSGPALAMAAGWMLMQAQHHRAAFGVLALPLMVMGLTFVMYWAVPNAGG